MSLSPDAVTYVFLLQLLIFVEHHRDQVYTRMLYILKQPLSFFNWLPHLLARISCY